MSKKTRDPVGMILYETRLQQYAVLLVILLRWHRKTFLTGSSIDTDVMIQWVCPFSEPSTYCVHFRMFSWQWHRGI